MIYIYTFDFAFEGPGKSTIMSHVHDGTLRCSFKLCFYVFFLCSCYPRTWYELPYLLFPASTFVHGQRTFALQQTPSCKNVVSNSKTCCNEFRDRLHIMVDTGLNREGLAAQEVAEAATIVLQKWPSWSLDGFYTHWCCVFEAQNMPEPCEVHTLLNFHISHNSLFVWEPKSLHLVRYDPVEMHRSLAVFEHALGLVQDWSRCFASGLCFGTILSMNVYWWATRIYLLASIKNVLRSCMCAIMYKLALSLSCKYSCVFMHCCLVMYALGSTRFWSVQGFVLRVVGDMALDFQAACDVHSLTEGRDEPYSPGQVTRLSNLDWILNTPLAGSQENFWRCWKSATNSQPLRTLRVGWEGM